MSRSIKKGPVVAPELYKRVEELNKAGEKKVLKTWSRSSTIFPSFVYKISYLTTNFLNLNSLRGKRCTKIISNSQSPRT